MLSRVARSHSETTETNSGYAKNGQSSWGTGSLTAPKLIAGVDAIIQSPSTAVTLAWFGVCLLLTKPVNDCDAVPGILTPSLL